MVALSRRANYIVHDLIDGTTLSPLMPRRHLVGEDSLDRLGRAADICDHRVVIVRVEPAHIANLPARVRIEARRIENDFTPPAPLQLRHTDAILHQRTDASAIHSK